MNPEAFVLAMYTWADLARGFGLIKFTITITKHNVRPRNPLPSKQNYPYQDTPSPGTQNWIPWKKNSGTAHAHWQICIELPLTTSNERMNCKYQQYIVFVCKVFFHALFVFLSGGNKYDGSPIHHQGRDGDYFTGEAFFLLLSRQLLWGCLVSLSQYCRGRSVSLIDRQRICWWSALS